MDQKVDPNAEGFKKLDAWQEARSLANMLSELIKRPPLNKDYGLCDRIWKAALAIMLNIGEGFGSPTNKQFYSFLVHAKRSVGEIKSHLYHIFDQRQISRDEFEEIHGQAVLVGEEITSLMADIKSGGKRGK